MTMTQREAFGLSERIVKTWPNGPRQSVWAEVLVELQDAPARATYEHLRDTMDKAPSVAMFRADYRDRTRRPYDEERVVCARCEGSGMVTVWESHGGVEYSAVVACVCTVGVRMAATLGRIITDNDRELERTFPHRDRTYVRLPDAPVPAPVAAPA